MDRSPPPPASLQTPRSTVVRRSGRGQYEREPVFAILDEAMVCHVAFVADGVAMSLPTLHARIDDLLYLHGALGNHMLKVLSQCPQVSATCTLVDGLVFARSAFHHSMNYRSAVVFGSAAEVTALPEKRRALAALVERVAAGRMQETREPSDAELRGTRVLRIAIAEASAKVRSGPPIDDAADLSGGGWAGVLPLRVTAGPLCADALLPAGIPLSPAVAARAAALGTSVDQPVEWSRGPHLVSTERSRLDLALVHGFLSQQSYWARGVSTACVEGALQHSFCFGLYRDAQQLGFARVVSDTTRMAYLADVFIVESARGAGLGTWLLQCAFAHPALSQVLQWLLATRDAHAFYERLGFQKHSEGRYMTRPSRNEAVGP